MTRILNLSMALGLAALMLVGCSESTDPDANTTAANSSETRLRAAMSVEALSGDVAGILFQIECADGSSFEEYVPLEDELTPPWIDPSGHVFADLFQVLPPGECTVIATPMSAPGVPSEDCGPSEPTTVTIEPGKTTEVVILMNCDGKDNGALDSIGVINHQPVIIDLDLGPSKFITQCEELTVTATAEDPEGNPLTYVWVVTTEPAGAVYWLDSTGNVATFTAEVPGYYEITVTVDDGNGGSTSLTFPVHVSDVGIEHCQEACCELPDGTIQLSWADGCEEQGGTVVPDDKCEETVCCIVNGVPGFVPAADCPDGNVQPLDACNQEFCCKFEDATGVVAFSFAGPEQCDDIGGSFVPADECKEVCCKLKDGTFGSLPLGDCLAAGGASAAPDLCETLCCRDQEGNVFIASADECVEPLAVAPLELCKSDEICCSLPGAFPQIVPTQECIASGGTILPADECGDTAINLDVNFSLDPNAPCDPEPLLVVPSSSANELAIYDLDTLLPLPTSPFPTCANPSRIIFDWNNDAIASCRSDSHVSKHTKDGVLIWDVLLPGCLSGARGVVISPDGRLFASCTAPGTVYELDQGTGAVLNTISLPGSGGGGNPGGETSFVYGLSADVDGLYVADLAEAAVHKINLLPGNPLDLTIAWTANQQVYGITTDGVGHVWVGGSSVKQLNTADGTLANLWAVPSYVTGIMAAPNGNIYGGMPSANGVVEIDPIGGTVSPTFTLPAGDTHPRGVTLDIDSNLYTINLVSHSLTKFDGSPTGLTGATTQFGSGILSSPYGYSGDMTGINLCLTTLIDEWLSGPIDSGSATNVWDQLDWSATTPPGTNVVLYYSTDNATWTQATANPQALAIASQIIYLKAVLTSPSSTLIPSLDSVTLSYTP